jgi:hypothetical protein
MSEHSTGDTRPGSAGAARLLQTGDVVGDRVRAAIDARTKATVDAWMAVAALTYALAVALSCFGDMIGIGPNPGVPKDSFDGPTVVFLVIAAFFTVTALAEGLTTSLRQPLRPSPARRFFTAGASALPLVTLLVMAFAVPATPLPLVLAIAVVSSVPVGVLALRSAQRARTAGVRRPEPTLAGLLDPAGRAVTAGLGLALGALGTATGLPIPLLGSIAFIVFTLVLFGTRGARGSIGRVAEYWGRAQWTALGCSYLLVLGLSVLLARTEGDRTVVSIVGGILVAAPLVFAAFRPAPIWEA